MELCPECNESSFGCKQCDFKRLQQNFNKWTSGNEFIDKFIQESQLKSEYRSFILEWIPYNRLTNVKYLDKGGFSAVYKAIWLDGPIARWDYRKQQWSRYTEVIDINSCYERYYTKTIYYHY